VQQACKWGLSNWELSKSLLVIRYNNKLQPFPPPKISAGCSPVVRCLYAGESEKISTNDESSCHRYYTFPMISGVRAGLAKLSGTSWWECLLMCVKSLHWQQYFWNSIFCFAHSSVLPEIVVVDWMMKQLMFIMRCSLSSTSYDWFVFFTKYLR